MVLFNDGEFSVIQTHDEGHLIHVESRVFGKKTGAWLLTVSTVEAIKAAEDSNEVMKIIEKSE